MTSSECLRNAEHMTWLVDRDFCNSTVPHAWTMDIVSFSAGNLLATLCLRWISVGQCLSTFLLQRNLSQICALLMEPYVMIQVSILLQQHRTVVTNFVPGNSVCFGGTLAATCGTLRFSGTLVENLWCKVNPKTKH